MTAIATSRVSQPFTRPDAQAVIAECLGRIITGRPLPEGMRAPEYAPARAVTTVREGITMILSGPRA